MNEQDMIIQEKIKKREKTDIALAYMLIVILLGCILFMVYLKFIRKDSGISDNATEYTVNYMKLEDIASSINNNLSSKYSGINANASENSINVNYGDLLYTINVVNNELEFRINNDNKEFSKDIYEEIITSICTYYNNDRDGCKSATESITFGNNVDGVRFVGEDTLYINIASGVKIATDNEVTTYTAETVVDITNMEYELNINNKKITDINVDVKDVSTTVSGNLSDKGNVTVKLYDVNNELLEEKTMESENNFSISFEYNDKLNLDSIKKYSINIE